MSAAIVDSARSISSRCGPVGRSRPRSSSSRTACRRRSARTQAGQPSDADVRIEPGAPIQRQLRHLQDSQSPLLLREAAMARRAARYRRPVRWRTAVRGAVAAAAVVAMTLAWTASAGADDVPTRRSRSRSPAHGTYVASLDPGGDPTNATVALSWTSTFTGTLASDGTLTPTGSEPSPRAPGRSATAIPRTASRAPERRRSRPVLRRRPRPWRKPSSRSSRRPHSTPTGRAAATPPARAPRRAAACRSTAPGRRRTWSASSTATFRTSSARAVTLPAKYHRTGDAARIGCERAAAVARLVHPAVRRRELYGEPQLVRDRGRRAGLRHDHVQRGRCACRSGRRSRSARR